MVPEGGLTVPESHRHGVLVYTSSPVVSLASETLTDRIPITMEQASSISDNSEDDTNEQEFALVNTFRESLRVPSLGFLLMDHNYIQCKLTGVGCPLQRIQDTGKMDLSHQINDPTS